MASAIPSHNARPSAARVLLTTRWIFPDLQQIGAHLTPFEINVKAEVELEDKYNESLSGSSGGGTLFVNSKFHNFVSL